MTTTAEKTTTNQTIVSTTQVKSNSRKDHPAILTLVVMGFALYVTAAIGGAIATDTDPNAATPLLAIGVISGLTTTALIVGSALRPAARR